MPNKKLKIACTSWHIMHYWDLFNALKDDAEFHLIHNSWRSWKDPRFLNHRLIPENAKFVSHFDPEEYDLAILNIDQQIVNPEIQGKNKVFKELLSSIHGKVPLIIINHGAPYYPEFLKHGNMNDEDAKEECKRLVRKLIPEDATMVTNSYQAAEDWGWGHPIHHGINPDDWDNSKIKEPYIITALSPAGLPDYYNRDCMNAVLNILQDTGYKLQWARVNIKTQDSIDGYKNFLARGLIYLDTSYKTPMNRARTEAMLSGCAVFQVKGAHDLDMFAENRKNMVLLPNNPTVIAETMINYLENNYDELIKIGQEGRKMVLEKFNYTRYREDWLALIDKVL